MPTRRVPAGMAPVFRGSGTLFPDPVSVGMKTANATTTAAATELAPTRLQVRVRRLRRADATISGTGAGGTGTAFPVRSNRSIRCGSFIVYLVGLLTGHR